MSKSRALKPIAIFGLIFLSFSSLIQAGKVLGASTPSLVQVVTSNSMNNGIITATLPGNVTQNDVLAFALVWTDSTHTITQVTASCVSGNFTIVSNLTTGAPSTLATGYGIVNSSGTCTVTATLSGQPTFGAFLAVHDISGINTTTPTDGSNASLNGYGTAANSGNITTTKNGDYLFGFLHIGFCSPTTWALGSGWTQETISSETGVSIDQIQSSAGTASASGTASVSCAMAGAIIAFQPASGSGGGQPPPDTTPPSVPTNLTATAISASTINLSWSSSTDNVGVTGYTIYRGGAQIGTSATNSYGDNGLSPSTQYTYTVDAYDAAGNHSSQSVSASATTQVQQQAGNYPWSGIIAPSRAMDWSGAGIPGGLPDANWPICATIQAYSGTAAAIVNALAACNTAHPTGGVVVLGAGTFTLSTGINFPINTTGHLALRGQGAASTQLNFSGAAAGCNGDSAFICAGSSDGTYASNSNSTITFTNWTGGYAQGSTQITLASVAGIVPGQTVLVLNQCDTGFSGADCLTGSPIDNGGYFECSSAWTAVGIGCGVPSEGPDGPDYRKNAWEMEGAMVTGINQGGCGATCVTLSHPLEHPNWSASQNPIAILLQPIPQVGVENLSLDGSADQSVSAGIYIWTAWEPWVSGVEVTNMFAHSVGYSEVWNGLIQNNYFYGNPGAYNDNTGAHPRYGGNNLVQNNICQKIKLCILTDGPDVADVFAYNYSPIEYSGISSDFLYSGTINHSAGGDLQLFEGNAFDQTEDDSDHGGHLEQTRFRNFIWGWTSCANGQCGTYTSIGSSGSNVDAYVSGFGTRYAAFVANVLGTPGYHNQYRSHGCYAAQSIYVLGCGNQNGGAQPTDTLTQSTSLFWGNWDTVSNATRWCGNSGDTGWSSTCASLSEVPTVAPAYPNPIPTLGDTAAGMGPLPASFYLSAKPSWWGNLPWPAIGPDVSGGNIGQCGGALNTAGKFNGLPADNSAQCAGSTLNAAWAGHVNTTPAMNCYLNVMGGTPDGTGNAPLIFNPSICYASSGGSDTTPPAPPTGVSVQ